MTLTTDHCSSPPQRIPVSPRVRSPHKPAILRINHNALAAPDFGVPGAQPVETVAHLRQFQQDILPNPRFDIVIRERLDRR